MASQQVRWLVGGFAVGFLVPFVFADLLGMQRDVYYGVYAVVAFGFFGLWARSTDQSIRALIARRWVPAIVLGLVVAGVMSFIALQQDATSRPAGLTLAAALAWRGGGGGTARSMACSSRRFRSSRCSPPSPGLHFAPRSGRAKIGVLALLGPWS